MTIQSMGKYCSILLLLYAGITRAQKNIVISEGLAANAEKLPVKMGTQWFGKIWKFRFGDYTVISSKMGWTQYHTKSNFWGTKTESSTSEKFSFFLADKSDTAKVNAANNTNIESAHPYPALDYLFNVEVYEWIIGAKNFSAFFNINSDTTETWTLLLHVLKGKGVESNTEAYLTNGTRIIEIRNASSNKNGDDNRSILAMGYELFEKDQPLAAVQYYGGGNMGMNKNIIWLGNVNDGRMKLILSAAMTALLQIKVTAPMGM